MTLKSAFEDLLSTTLSAISGSLSKIQYLSSLRPGGKGTNYQHWGLARVYGDAAAQQALGQAHGRLFLNVLRTSLKDLHSGGALGRDILAEPAREYLEQLRAGQADLLPEDLGGGSPRHFNSVLRALSSLAKHAPPSTPRA